MIGIVLVLILRKVTAFYRNTKAKQRKHPFFRDVFVLLIAVEEFGWKRSAACFLYSTADLFTDDAEQHFCLLIAVGSILPHFREDALSVLLVTYGFECELLGLVAVTFLKMVFG